MAPIRGIFQIDLILSGLVGDLSERALFGQLARMHTGGSEAANAADCVVELLNLDHIGRRVFLDDELGYAITLLYLEVLLAKVEEENLDFSTVVTIDHTSADINHMLSGKSRARGDTAVVTLRNSHG